MFESRPPEDQLKSSDTRLRTLAAATSSVVFYTAGNGAVVMQNPSWEAFTGQPEREYAGWGWLTAIHPDDRPRVDAAWREAVAARAPMQMRYRLRRHDGAYRDVAAQAAPVIEHGTVREWVGLCVDETASRAAEAALRLSEERFRFLDQLGEVTRNLTDATRLMATTARLLGEYLGATRCAYADVEPDGDRFTIRSDWSVEGVPSSAGVYSLDLFGPQATSYLRRGQHLVVRDVDRELGDEGGGRMFNAIGIKAIICAALVKDDRLVAMMAVHQAKPRDWTTGEIAVVCEVVDRCWAHIERVRDNAMLREQDRRKDEFLATLAHELRNPLAPMRYAIATTRHVKEGAQLARAHDIIDRQVAQMARLIDDLLDVSRINRGLIELQRERVALAPLMLQAVETVRPAIEAAQHRLELQLPGGDVMLDADPLRIVQVIANLLGNAAKYTPDGGRIRLAAWQAGALAVLEVADNGIGIPHEDQSKVFQIFCQLSHTAGRAKGGLGIGLSLVKTLVQMHGGDVRVASAGLDEGSTFTVELPLAVSALAEASPAPLPDPAVAAGLRVLVVEDNEDGRESLVTLLEALGHEVGEAADGEQALVVARRFAPAVVLLDLGLPRMDGYEVARRMRADPQLKDLHIVALTGWGATRDRTLTAQAGFDNHLTKPVEPDTLVAYLAAHAARLQTS